MTSTAVAVRPSGQLSDPIALGEVLARSGYFQDARDAAKAAVKVMAGAELGFGPIASMRGVDIIKGEVSLSAGLTAALVRGSRDYDYVIKEWDDNGCVLVFTRHGKPLHPEISFNRKDAERAGLASGDNYRKFPRSMFFARAITMGARAHCPELFGGSVYVPEELGASDEKLVEDVKQAFDATEVQANGEPTTAPTQEDISAMARESAPPVSEPQPEPVAEAAPQVDASEPVSAEEAATMTEWLGKIGAPESFWRAGLMMLGLDGLTDLNKGQAHQLMAEAKDRYAAPGA